MSEKERSILGDRLRKAREYLGLSQEEVSNHLQIPRSAISLIESGQRKVDHVELKKLAALYERPISDFLDAKEPKMPAVGEIEILKRATQDLSKQDIQEVLKFAEFLKARARRQEDGE